MTSFRPRRPLRAASEPTPTTEPVVRDPRRWSPAVEAVAGLAILIACTGAQLALLAELAR